VKNKSKRKNETVINIVVYNRETKLKGMWKGERRIWFLPFLGGIPLLSFIEQSVRPSNRFIGEQARQCYQSLDVFGRADFHTDRRDAVTADPLPILFSRKRSTRN